MRLYSLSGFRLKPVKRIYIVSVLLALTLMPGCSSQCSSAKDSITSLEADNKQIKEKALREWEIEKQYSYSLNNSSWNETQSFKVRNIRRIWSDFESYFRDNGGFEYMENKDLMNRIIVNNQKCFDPIAVAEAEQALRT